ncbi:MAG: hypothetical protein GY860_17105 [Desulfobacteraceae bacterium]|nr:hypothetical protein [Desulfobacteraceae bacterium]
MKSKSKYIKEFLIGKSDQFGMKSRVFNQVTVFIAFAALVDAIVEFYIGLPPRIYLFGPFVTTCSGLLYTYSRFYKKYQTMVWPLMILGYVIVSYHWYFAGGLMGASSLLALGFISVMPVLMDKKQLFMALSIMIILASVFFLIEADYPQILSDYPKTNFQLQDIFTTLILLSIILVIAIFTIVKDYQTEHDKVTKSNKLLQKANSELEKKNRELEKAFDDINELSGLVPICSNCKKIRDDKGYWNQIESYIERHSQASFSHGICPDCSDKFYGDQKWYIKMKKNNSIA